MCEDRIYIWLREVGGLLLYLNKFIREKIVLELMIHQSKNSPFYLKCLKLKPTFSIINNDI